jgi:Fe2+ or Zn2+ uptake regulation protein
VKLFRIKSLVSDFFQETDNLDEAKILAEWNFQKGYEIVAIQSGKLIERWEHHCWFCRKCNTCKHLFSEHSSEELKCLEKKCKCKEFVHAE